MAWTEIARQRYCRAGLRYASDLTDAEWALIEPFMPLPPLTGGLDKERVHEVVALIDEIAGRIERL